ncbi:hypothetical protein Tco_0782326 [Tanacetum coccineum]
MKKRFGKKESVSKQGRKKSKPESTLDDNTVFDDQDADNGMEYMETEEVMDEGRQSGETEEVKLTNDTEVVEDKSSGDKGGNAEELVSTARPEVSTARPDIDAARPEVSTEKLVSTARPEVSTARPDIDTARQEDSAVEPKTHLITTSIFDDEDITMAQTLIKMKEEKAKEKGVSIKDVDDSLRPDWTLLSFLEDQPNMAGIGPDWMFDLDFLTNTMNYIPVRIENHVNMDAGTQESYVAGSSGKKKLFKLHKKNPSENAPKDYDVHDLEDVAEKEEQHKLTEAEQSLEKMIFENNAFVRMKRGTVASQKRAAQLKPSGKWLVKHLFEIYLGGQIPIDASTHPNADLPTDPNMPDLEDDSDVFPNEGMFSGAYDDEDVGADADFNNMDNTIDNRTNHKDHQNCLLACFLSQEEPKNISQALEDESWVEAMQEELLQFSHYRELGDFVDSGHLGKRQWHK